jgi:hypothetical protein
VSGRRTSSPPDPDLVCSTFDDEAEAPEENGNVKEPIANGVVRMDAVFERKAAASSNNVFGLRDGNAVRR